MKAKCFVAMLVLVVSPAAVSAEIMEWVTVGDPGNTPDTEIMSQDGTTGYGAVDDI